MDSGQIKIKGKLLFESLSVSIHQSQSQSTARGVDILDSNATENGIYYEEMTVI